MLPATVETALLTRFFQSTASNSAAGTGYHRNYKIHNVMPADFIARIQGKTVIDFGCGCGDDAIEIAKSGAKKVIGVDIREDFLALAREASAGVRNVSFTTRCDEKADAIISVDAFEHFADPAAILRTMAGMLKPGGEILISFGPTWYHPRGGHLFSVFPWAHLLFSERALIAWRSRFKNDGATRFGEVAGGLNQMTVARFERIVRDGGLRVASFQLIPIRALRPVHNRLTREFTTASIRCRLVLIRATSQNRPEPDEIAVAGVLPGAG